VSETTTTEPPPPLQTVQGILIGPDEQETEQPPSLLEDDWLTGQACTLDADGNVDPECQACQ